MTKRALIINSSTNGEKSFTNKIIKSLIDQLNQIHSDLKCTHNDLSANQPPHLTQEIISAFYTPKQNQDEKAAQLISYSENAISSLVANDIIILGAPMWNFSVPSTLKAWIDNIVRPGLTFQYENGQPKGLLNNKKLVIISSRGGVYSVGDATSMDFQEKYLASVFNFIGVKDQYVIRVEGVGQGAEFANAALEKSLLEVESIAKKL